MAFAELGLPQALCEHLRGRGWSEPTPIQQLAIPCILEGRDVLGCAPTGTGKSAAFLLPGTVRLSRHPPATPWMLIIEPTRELARQVAELAGELCSGLGLQVEMLTGGTPYVPRQSGSGRLIIATVGRLAEYVARGWFEPGIPGLLVIDEADRMLDMGFGPRVRQLAGELPPRCQVLLFSATLDSFAVGEFARELLHDPVRLDVSAGAGRLPEALCARAYLARSEAQKCAVLRALLAARRDKAIVFVNSRDRAVQLCARLRGAAAARQSLAVLHGELDQHQRTAVLRRFAGSSDGVLVATDVAARGIDIEAVAVVYNYDMPQRAVTYVHRAGRTARAGQGGTVISLLLSGELPLLGRLERYTGQSIIRATLAGISADFPAASAQKKSRARAGNRLLLGRSAPPGPSGGAQRQPRAKQRRRDQKNIGRPDFERKRARRQARHPQPDGGPH